MPVTALLTLFASGRTLRYVRPVNPLNLAIPLVLVMVMICGVVYVLEHAFDSNGALDSSEVPVSGIVWLGIAI